MRLVMKVESYIMNPGKTAYQDSLCLSIGLLLISKFISETKQISMKVYNENLQCKVPPPPWHNGPYWAMPSSL